MRVKDFEKSRKFYSEGLGFIERFSWGKDPKRTILMDTGDGNYFEISKGDHNHSDIEGVFRHLALRVDDCKAALELVRNAGAEVTVEARTLHYPVTRQCRSALHSSRGLMEN